MKTILRAESSRRPAAVLSLSALLILCLVRPLVAAELEDQLREASAAVQPIQEELEQQVTEGRLTQANERLLAVFPQATRTPVQALLLGNMLYGMDAKLSYALHKEAAAKLPQEPLALMEWGMEQHRAGEYAGALAAYDAYSTAQPEFAPIHGLATDCLIRLGKTKEAVARWQQSERARRGTLETLETLVCEIYKDPTLQQRRAGLRERALKGDVDAAVALIALDGKYERDWWNSGPQRVYLKTDLPLLQKLPAGPRVKAAQCVGECLLLEEPSKADLHAILTRYGFLIDPAKTLPPDGALLSLLLGLALETDVLTREQARQQFGEKLLATGKRTKRADLLNLVAHLNSGTTAMADIEKQAWEATDDPRFAAGYLLERLSEKTLKADDALLAKAMQQFPEDSWIIYVAIVLNDAPREDLLVRGIKAEFRHFSGGASLIMRPNARTLRSYINKLEKVAR